MEFTKYQRVTVETVQMVKITKDNIEDVFELLFRNKSVINSFSMENLKEQILSENGLVIVNPDETHARILPDKCIYIDEGDCIRVLGEFEFHALFKEVE